MAKGYWIAHVDVQQRRGLQALCRRQSRHLSRNSAAASWCAPANSKPWKATTRSRNVVIEFPDYAAALACYRSPEYQANIKVRQPHSTVDLSSSRATTARSRKLFCPCVVGPSP